MDGDVVTGRIAFRVEGRNRFETKVGSEALCSSVQWEIAAGHLSGSMEAGEIQEGARGV